MLYVEKSTQSYHVDIVIGVVDLLQGVVAVEHVVDDPSPRGLGFRRLLLWMLRGKERATYGRMQQDANL